MNLSDSSSDEDDQFVGPLELAKFSRETLRPFRDIGSTGVILKDKNQPNKGYVFFSLEEIPLNINFTTQNNDSFTRVGETHKLPQDLQKEVQKSNIPIESLKGNNLKILLNVIRFTKKRDFRFSYPSDQRSSRRELSMAVLKAARDSIVEDNNAKKYFKIEELSGKGGFGSVFGAEQLVPDKRRVALKKMEAKTEKQKLYSFAEVGSLITCMHPNIVRYLRSYKMKDEIWVANQFLISLLKKVVLEFMIGGTVENAVQIHPFSESEIAFIARESLQGLSFMHYKNLLHRDIKASNIMLTEDGSVKLIDFGLCADLSGGPLSHMCGSPYYMAPEIIQNKTYSYPADIWSFGVVILLMILKRLPKFTNSLQGMYVIGTEGLAQYIPSTASPELKDFLIHCLKTNPEQRLSANDLLDHPFIKKACSRKDMAVVVIEIFVHNALMMTGVL